MPGQNREALARWRRAYAFAVAQSATPSLSSAAALAVAAEHARWADIEAQLQLQLQQKSVYESFEISEVEILEMQLEDMSEQLSEQMHHHERIQKHQRAEAAAALGAAADESVAMLTKLSAEVERAKTELAAAQTEAAEAVGARVQDSGKISVLEVQIAQLEQQRREEAAVIAALRAAQKPMLGVELLSLMEHERWAAALELLQQKLAGGGGGGGGGGDGSGGGGGGGGGSGGGGGGGAWVTQRTDAGSQAIHLLLADEADEDETLPLLHLLLQLGADPNSRDGAGKTSLMLAAQAPQPRAVVQLLNADADVAALDNRGRSAIDLALENAALQDSDSEGSVEESFREEEHAIVELLKRHGAPWGGMSAAAHAQLEAAEGAAATAREELAAAEGKLKETAAHALEAEQLAEATVAELKMLESQLEMRVRFPIPC